MDPYRTAHAPLLPTAVYPAAPIEPMPTPGPVVWVPDAYGRMVPMPKEQAPPPMERPPARDLTPQPLIDPRAQLVAAGGVAVGCAGAGIGWGIGQAALGIAAIGSSTGVIAVLLLLLALRFAGPRGGTTNVTTTVHNHNRGLFSRSHTTTN